MLTTVFIVSVRTEISYDAWGRLRNPEDWKDLAHFSSINDEPYPVTLEFNVAFVDMTIQNDSYIYDFGLGTYKDTNTFYNRIEVPAYS